jgi:hypothetical protein
VIDRLQRASLWPFLLAAAGLVALVVLLGVDDLVEVVVFASAVVTVLAGVASAVLQVYNPFEPRPKPHLTLRPVDGEERTSATISATVRTVDVDAVVAEAEATARVFASSTGIVAMSQYAKPTQADHDKFEKALAAYKGEIRVWAQEAEEWLQAQATVLVAEVIHHNPTSVDALQAGIYIALPAGSEEYEKTDPPEVPERPMFPRRRSVLAGGLFEPPSPGTWARRGPRVSFELPHVEPYSPDAPDYETKRDGTLEVFYGRWPIRHREDEVAGDPFSVRLPVGEHKVPWEVRATNLPHHAKGTWTIAVKVEPSQRPITTVAELEAALRGEPEDTVDRLARLQELIGEG